MIYAMSRASVPKICLVVRKAYGAGLYAMCGPAFEPEAVLALPTAKIAVMGPEPAVNAVFANKMAEFTQDENLPENEVKPVVIDNAVSKNAHRRFTPGPSPAVSSSVSEASSSPAAGSSVSGGSAGASSCLGV